MTFTYNPSAWGASPPNLELVRLRLGDTDEARVELQDEEITTILAETGDSVPAAAVKCCELILARYSRQVDETGPGITVTRSQRFSQLKDLLHRLRDELNRTAQPVATLGSRSAESALLADEDFRPPQASVGLGRPSSLVHPGRDSWDRE